MKISGKGAHARGREAVGKPLTSLTSLTDQERAELLAWLVEIDRMIELVDLVISDVEASSRPQPTRIRRLWELRRAIQAVGDHSGMVEGESP